MKRVLGRSRWIAYAVPSSADRQLVCIAHSGGGASFFARWQSHFGDTVQVLPVQLPGRENRVREELVSSCSALSSELARALVEDIGLAEDFAVFGHSLGGVIGFELVHRLAVDHGRRASLCAISAVAPCLNADHRPSAELDDAAFLERVTAFGGLDHLSVITNNPEAWDLYTRILRADFAAVESFRPATLSGSRIPIRAYLGDEDPVVTPHAIVGWQAYTDGEFSLRLMPGGHFYVQDHWAELAADIGAHAFASGGVQ